MKAKVTRSARYSKVFSAVLALQSLALLLVNAAALASEARLVRDPRVSLDTLRTEHRVQLSVDKRGGVYRIDASAVLVGTQLERLRSASADFDRYTKMGMPNLIASKVVQRSGQTVWTWSHLSTSGQTSKHYYEVHLLPEGSTWFQVPRRAPWTDEDDSAFSLNEGSWYMEPQSDGSIYVRYFLALQIDTAIPEFIVDMVAGQKLAKGVRDVVRVLARDAGAEPVN